MAEDSRVIFTKGDGDCEDNLWDDSLLIAAYDRATKKGDVVKRDWRLGENVRCDFEGVEYEAVIQCLDHGKGTATVRYIGYNNIEKVKIKELKLSLGQDQRDFQLLEAEGDEESSSLQKYEGESSWNVGDHCISIYKEDQRPYEAIITHMDSQSATVRFIGYDNIQSNNSLTELQPSNGENARHLQTEVALKEKFSKSMNLNPSQIPPPPPPLSFTKNKPENVALNSLLISWYQAGYHAGYLDALQKSS